ncbi:hypothetical protein JX266_012229 [Neoarthrinium moseri]|nr:hypothetical protein JX266_012229 [Neoarthrinium moseri]
MEPGFPLVGDQSENQEQHMVLFVAPGTSGTTWLSLLPIDQTQDGEQVFNQLNIFLKSDDFKASPAKSMGMFGKLFFKEVLSIGALSDVRLADYAATMSEVLVSDSSPSTELTSARRRPQLLRGGRPFVELYPHLILGSPEGKGLILQYVLKKVVVMIAFITTLFAWCLVGTAVGVTMNSFQIGVQVAGIGAGITAVLTPLVALMMHH